ncbi:MAG: hypothetical protein KF678_02825 [Phycisphaeraceae bacterium]|nr:hypothetical protein [Phycisphaeraceae bacterium]
MSDRVVKLKASCIHLRHKAMYSDPAHDVRGFVDESIDTIPFFCLLTCDCLGPDNESAGPAECRPGRSCYCSAEDPSPSPK